MPLILEIASYFQNNFITRDDIKRGFVSHQSEQTDRCLGSRRTVATKASCATI
jgi:hypothetical protein